MQIKKITAIPAALVLTASIPAEAVRASDEASPVHISIDQKELTLDEAKALDYQIPVFVRLTENPGVTSIEFGIETDSRCACAVINDTYDAYNLTGEYLGISMTTKTNDTFTWAVWAAGSPSKREMNMLLVLVQIPETVSGGEVFTINYRDKSSGSRKNHAFEENLSHYYYKNISWTDGYIRIAGEIQSGDLNGDNDIDIMDVILINKAIFGKAHLTEEQIQAADINKSGAPDSTDALTVMKYIIKLIDTLA